MKKRKKRWKPTYNTVKWRYSFTEEDYDVVSDEWCFRLSQSEIMYGGDPPVHLLVPVDQDRYFVRCPFIAGTFDHSVDAFDHGQLC